MRGNWSVSAAAPVPPDRQLLGVELLECRDVAGLVPGDADADFVVGAADPGELVAVELRMSCGRAADRTRCRGRWCRAPCRPWVRRCRASWPAAASRRPPCSWASRSGCPGYACRGAGRSAAHRRRSRRRRCSRSSGRRSCPCRNRPGFARWRSRPAARRGTRSRRRAGQGFRGHVFLLVEARANVRGADPPCRFI